MNVNEAWKYVRSVFPEAVFDYWYSHGELIFYRTPTAETPSACYMKDGKLTIEHDF